MPFLLDTGASGSTISAGLASRVGANVVAKTTIVSAAGQKAALVVRLDRLIIGDETADGVLATLASKDALALPDLLVKGRRIEGVIGQDVLAALRYTIDYRERTIVWHHSDETLPSCAAVFDLEPRDQRFVAVVPQGRRVLRLVPDSGAEALVLFERGNRPRGDVRFLPGPGRQISGPAGSRIARMAVMAALQVGSTRFTDVPAVVVAAEPGAAVDGLLPLHFFARVTFNGPDRQLLVEVR